MRIAFYAPLKPPDHPNASGDRTLARLLVAALRRAGHDVDIASRLRSRDGNGDPARQERIERVGWALADRFTARCHRHPDRRPALWFTYHLYYKAPDWLGPRVADALAIPYVVAEASLAQKRAGGPWRAGHEATEAAVRRADGVIGFNSADRAALLPALANPGRWHALKPFIETAPFAAATVRRADHRAALQHRFAIPADRPLLVAVAMMRPGDKLASYRCLAAALALIAERPWHLLVVGDGVARNAVMAAFATFAGRVSWLGFTAADCLPKILAAGDLFVWPAINEAFGMALLEAQAAHLPVVAGASGGVPDIVAHDVTGRLTPPGDSAALAAAVGALLADRDVRLQMAEAAARRSVAEHDIGPAARNLDGILRGIVGEHCR